MLVFRWQKAEHELLKVAGKEGKVYGSESKGTGDLKKQPGGFLCGCKKVNRDRTETVQFDLVMTCQLLTLE